MRVEGGRRFWRRAAGERLERVGLCVRRGRALSSVLGAGRLVRSCALQNGLGGQQRIEGGYVCHKARLYGQAGYHTVKLYG